MIKFFNRDTEAKRNAETKTYRWIHTYQEEMERFFANGGKTYIMPFFGFSPALMSMKVAKKWFKKRGYKVLIGKTGVFVNK